MYFTFILTFGNAIIAHYVGLYIDMESHLDLDS